MGMKVTGVFAKGGGGFDYIQFVELLTSGTWTVPEGCYMIHVAVVGGGGGSGGNSGRGGAVVREYYVSVEPGQVFAVTIGSGGSSGGGNGSNSTFGEITAAGGFGNQTGAVPTTSSALWPALGLTLLTHGGSAGSSSRRNEVLAGAGSTSDQPGAPGRGGGGYRYTQNSAGGSGCVQIIMLMRGEVPQ